MGGISAIALVVRPRTLRIQNARDGHVNLRSGDILLTRDGAGAEDGFLFPHQFSLKVVDARLLNCRVLHDHQARLGGFKGQVGGGHEALLLFIVQRQPGGVFLELGGVPGLEVGDNAPGQRGINPTEHLFMLHPTCVEPFPGLAVAFFYLLRNPAQVFGVVRAQMWGNPVGVLLGVWDADVSLFLDDFRRGALLFCRNLLRSTDVLDFNQLALFVQNHEEAAGAFKPQVGGQEYTPLDAPEPKLIERSQGPSVGLAYLLADERRAILKQYRLHHP